MAECNNIILGTTGAMLPTGPGVLATSVNPALITVSLSATAELGIITRLNTRLEDSNYRLTVKKPNLSVWKSMITGTSTKSAIQLHLRTPPPIFEGSVDQVANSLTLFVGMEGADRGVQAQSVVTPADIDIQGYIALPTVVTTLVAFATCDSSKTAFWRPLQVAPDPPGIGLQVSVVEGGFLVLTGTVYLGTLTAIAAVSSSSALTASALVLNIFETPDGRPVILLNSDVMPIPAASVLLNIGLNSLATNLCVSRVQPVGEAFRLFIGLTSNVVDLNKSTLTTTVAVVGGFSVITAVPVTELYGSITCRLTSIPSVLNLPLKTSGIALVSSLPSSPLATHLQIPLLLLQPCCIPYLNALVPLKLTGLTGLISAVPIVSAVTGRLANEMDGTVQCRSLHTGSALTGQVGLIGTIELKSVVPDARLAVDMNAVVELKSNARALLLSMHVALGNDSNRIASVTTTLTAIPPPCTLYSPFVSLAPTPAVVLLRSRVTGFVINLGSSSLISRKVQELSKYSLPTGTSMATPTTITGIPVYASQSAFAATTFLLGDALQSAGGSVTVRSAGCLGTSTGFTGSEYAVGPTLHLTTVLLRTSTVDVAGTQRTLFGSKRVGPEVNRAADYLDLPNSWRTSVASITGTGADARLADITVESYGAYDDPFELVDSVLFLGSILVRHNSSLQSIAVPTAVASDYYYPQNSVTKLAKTRVESTVSEVIEGLAPIYSSTAFSVLSPEQYGAYASGNALRINAATLAQSGTIASPVRIHGSDASFSFFPIKTNSRFAYSYYHSLQLEDRMQISAAGALGPIGAPQEFTVALVKQDDGAAIDPATVSVAASHCLLRITLVNFAAAGHAPSPKPNVYIDVPILGVSVNDPTRVVVDPSYRWFVLKCAPGGSYSTMHVVTVLIERFTADVPFKTEKSSAILATTRPSLIISDDQAESRARSLCFAQDRNLVLGEFSLQLSTLNVVNKVMISDGADTNFADVVSSPDQLDPVQASTANPEGLHLYILTDGTLAGRRKLDSPIPHHYSYDINPVLPYYVRAHIAAGGKFSNVKVGENIIALLTAPVSPAVTGRKLYIWGNNQYGHLNVPVTVDASFKTNHYIANVMAFDFHVAYISVVLDSGALHSWGCDFTDPDIWREASAPTQPPKIIGSPAWGRYAYNNVPIKHLAIGENYSVAVFDSRLIPTDAADIHIEQYGLAPLTIPVSVVGVAPKVPSIVYPRRVWNEPAEVFVYGPTGHDVHAGKVLACGANHTIFLKADGTVVCWGNNNDYSQTTVPVGLVSVIGVDAGDNHCIALKSDGTVVCWGRNNSGQTSVPAGLKAKRISAGGNFCLAIRAADTTDITAVNGPVSNDEVEDTLATWGDNSKEQCLVPVSEGSALGTTTHKYRLRFWDATCGWDHVIAIRKDDNAAKGLLAHPDLNLIVNSYLIKPELRIGGQVLFSDISGLRASQPIATVDILGDTIPNGSCGPGALTYSWQTTAGTDIEFLPVGSSLSWGGIPFCGNVHSGVYEFNGTVACWGDINKTVPGLIAGTSSAAGNLESSQCVATKVKLLGEEIGGIDANGEPILAAMVDAGYEHNVVMLRGGGAIKAWGSNQYGQLNHGLTSGGYEGVMISCGAWHSIAVVYLMASTGYQTLVCWGLNTSGQTTIPIGLNVPGLYLLSVAAGEEHTAVVKGNGTVVCWGSNTYGQSTAPAGSTFTQVSCGAHHCIALKSDGTVVCWGLNTSGQTTVPAGLTGVVFVAAGGYHNIVRKSDGTLVCWGNNSQGQCNIPAELTALGGVFHDNIAAGTYNTIVVADIYNMPLGESTVGNDFIFRWGGNLNGESFPPLLEHPRDGAYPAALVAVVPQILTADGTMYRTSIGTSTMNDPDCADIPIVSDMSFDRWDEVAHKWTPKVLSYRANQFLQFDYPRTDAWLAEQGINAWGTGPQNDTTSTNFSNIDVKRSTLGATSEWACYMPSVFWYPSDVDFSSRLAWATTYIASIEGVANATLTLNYTNANAAASLVVTDGTYIAWGNPIAYDLSCDKADYIDYVPTGDPAGLQKEIRRIPLQTREYLEYSCGRGGPEDWKYEAQRNGQFITYPLSYGEQLVGDYYGGPSRLRPVLITAGCCLADERHIYRPDSARAYFGLRSLKLYDTYLKVQGGYYQNTSRHGAPVVTVGGALFHAPTPTTSSSVTVHVPAHRVGILGDCQQETCGVVDVLTYSGANNETLYSEVFAGNLPSGYSIVTNGHASIPAGTETSLTGYHLLWSGTIAGVSYKFVLTGMSVLLDGYPGTNPTIDTVPTTVVLPFDPVYGFDSVNNEPITSNVFPSAWLSNIGVSVSKFARVIRHQLLYKAVTNIFNLSSSNGQSGAYAGLDIQTTTRVTPYKHLTNVFSGGAVESCNWDHLGTLGPKSMFAQQMYGVVISQYSAERNSGDVRSFNIGNPSFTENNVCLSPYAYYPSNPLTPAGYSVARQGLKNDDGERCFFDLDTDVAANTGFWLGYRSAYMVRGWAYLYRFSVANVPKYRRALVGGWAGSNVTGKLNIPLLGKTPLDSQGLTQPISSILPLVVGDVFYNKVLTTNWKMNLEQLTPIAGSFTAVACGQFHLYAISTLGKVHSVGANFGINPVYRSTIPWNPFHHTTWRCSDFRCEDHMPSYERQCYSRITYPSWAYGLVGYYFSGFYDYNASQYPTPPATMISYSALHDRSEIEIDAGLGLGLVAGAGLYLAEPYPTLSSITEWTYAKYPSVCTHFQIPNNGSTDCLIAGGGSTGSGQPSSAPYPVAQCFDRFAITGAFLFSVDTVTGLGIGLPGGSRGLVRQDVQGPGLMVTLIDRLLLGWRIEISDTHGGQLHSSDQLLLNPRMLYLAFADGPSGTVSLRVKADGDYVTWGSPTAFESPLIKIPSYRWFLSSFGDDTKAISTPVHKFSAEASSMWRASLPATAATSTKLIASTTGEYLGLYKDEIVRNFWEGDADLQGGLREAGYTIYSFNDSLRGTFLDVHPPSSRLRACTPRNYEEVSYGEASYLLAYSSDKYLPVGQMYSKLVDVVGFSTPETFMFTEERRYKVLVVNVPDSPIYEPVNAIMPDIAMCLVGPNTITGQCPGFRVFVNGMYGVADVDWDSSFEEDDSSGAGTTIPITGLCWPRLVKFGEPKWDESIELCNVTMYRDKRRIEVGDYASEDQFTMLVNYTCIPPEGIYPIAPLVHDGGAKFVTGAEELNFGEVLIYDTVTRKLIPQYYTPRFNFKGSSVLGMGYTVSAAARRTTDTVGSSIFSWGSDAIPGYSLTGVLSELDSLEAEAAAHILPEIVGPGVILPVKQFSFSYGYGLVRMSGWPAWSTHCASNPPTVECALACELGVGGYIPQTGDECLVIPRTGPASLYGEVRVVGQGGPILPVDLGPCSSVAAGSLHWAVVKCPISSTQAAGAGPVVAGLLYESAYAYGAQIVPANLPNCTSVAAGQFHTCALQADGFIRCWGAGTTAGGGIDQGQSIIPAAVALGVVVKIVCGQYFTAALLSTGVAHWWGSIAGSQVDCTDIGATQENIVVIRTGGGLINVFPSTNEVYSEKPMDSGYLSLGTGFSATHMVASKLNELRSWGGDSNLYGGEIAVAIPTADIAGSPDTPGTRLNVYFNPTPQSIITVGPKRSLIQPLISYNEIPADPLYGQPHYINPIPPFLKGLTPALGIFTQAAYDNLVHVIATAAGDKCYFAIHNTTAAAVQGSLAAWGTEQGDNVLTSVPTGTDFVKVASSHRHAAAIRADGTLVCWGLNDNGQCTSPAGAYSEVACGPTFTAAVKTDGSLVCWGSGPTIAAPYSSIKFKEISCGTGHIVGRAAQAYTELVAGGPFAVAVGDILALGANNKGQCNVPGFSYTNSNKGINGPVVARADYTVYQLATSGFSFEIRDLLVPPAAPATFTRKTIFTSLGLDGYSSDGPEPTAHLESQTLANWSDYMEGYAMYATEMRCETPPLLADDHPFVINSPIIYGHTSVDYQGAYTLNPFFKSGATSSVPTSYRAGNTSALKAKFVYAGRHLHHRQYGFRWPFGQGYGIVVGENNSINVFGSEFRPDDSTGIACYNYERPFEYNAIRAMPVISGTPISVGTFRSMIYVLDEDGGTTYWGYDDKIHNPVFGLDPTGEAYSVNPQPKGSIFLPKDSVIDTFFKAPIPTMVDNGTGSYEPVLRYGLPYISGLPGLSGGEWYAEVKLDRYFNGAVTNVRTFSAIGNSISYPVEHPVFFAETFLAVDVWPGSAQYIDSQYVMSLRLRGAQAKVVSASMFLLNLDAKHPILSTPIYNDGMNMPASPTAVADFIVQSTVTPNFQKYATVASLPPVYLSAISDLPTGITLTADSGAFTAGSYVKNIYGATALIEGLVGGSASSAETSGRVAGSFGLMTPTSISSLMGWYKTDSLGVPGSSISSWANSVGAAGFANLVQSITANQPIVTVGLAAKSAKFVDNTDKLYANTTPATTGFTYFVVLKKALIAAGQHGLFLRVVDPGSGGSKLVSGLGFTAGKPTVYSSNLASTATTQITANAGTIISGANIGASWNSASIYVNGVAQEIATEALVAYVAPLATTGYHLGCSKLIGTAVGTITAWDNNDEYFEVIAYSKQLSEEERQVVEGYLAHKFALTANLPSGHKWKTTPPVENPLQVLMLPDLTAAQNMTIDSDRMISSTYRPETWLAMTEFGLNHVGPRIVNNVLKDNHAPIYAEFEVRVDDTYSLMARTVKAVSLTIANLTVGVTTPPGGKILSSSRVALKLTAFALEIDISTVSSMEVTPVKNQLKSIRPTMSLHIGLKGIARSDLVFHGATDCDGPYGCLGMSSGPPDLKIISSPFSAAPITLKTEVTATLGRIVFLNSVSSPVPKIEAKSRVIAATLIGSVGLRGSAQVVSTVTPSPLVDLYVKLGSTFITSSCSLTVCHDLFKIVTTTRSTSTYTDRVSTSTLTAYLPPPIVPPDLDPPPTYT